MWKRFCHPAMLAVLIIVVSVAPLRADGLAIYLPKGVVDAEALIGPPPARNSAEHKTQMDIVLWLQKTRTPEQVTFVETPLDLERFAHILSDSLIAVDGIELKATFDAIIDEVRADYDALKAVYDKPRPFRFDERVEPVGDARPVAAYPSGHSIRAMVYGRLLSEVFPEHEEALMDLAYQVGYGRVIAGVHYPVDVTSGQKLGNAYADVIAGQPSFKEAVSNIRPH